MSERGEIPELPAQDTTWQGLDPATISIHAGRGSDGPGQPTNVPPVLASIYRQGPGVLYGRSENPTWTAFEEAIGALEGGRALAFSSGMGAVTAILDSLPLSSKVIASRDAYGGTRKQLEVMAAKGTLTFELIDVTDTPSVIDACEGAALLWLESPTNPMLSIADIAMLSQEAHRLGVEVVVDSTFATPYLQRPLELGADIVLHSATKFISGHSDVIMGLTITSDDDWYVRLLEKRTLGGAIPGPLEVFLALRGLRTLSVRMDRAQANAMGLAQRLSEHPNIESVVYPGLDTHPAHALAAQQMKGPGAMLCFVVAGGAEAAEKVCESTELIVHATSLGGIETSMERRARWEGEEATDPALIRMSVGCEALEDLWADLTKALG